MLIEHVRADTAGSAEMISKVKDKTKAAIYQRYAKTYNLEIIKNIENEDGNLTRFLIMGKNIQPVFGKKYINLFLFKLKVNQPPCINL